MNIKNISRKQVVATIVLMSVALSNIASAAINADNKQEKAGSPFLYASKNATLGESNKAHTSNLMTATFVSASKTPAHPKTLESGKSSVAREMFVESTGYNSEVAQTDDSPFTSANGTHVYWGMVAANFLPFGTRIKIPDYYGDQVFVIEDRMNRRYWERVDVWFEHKSDALKWGKRTVRIQILAS